MSSRVSRRSESKWDEESSDTAPYALRSKDDQKEQAAITRSQARLMRREREQRGEQDEEEEEGEEYPSEGEEDAAEEEQAEDFASSLRSSGQQLKSAAQDKAAELQRRAPKLPYSLTSGLDESKEALRRKKDQLVSELRREGASSDESSGGLTDLLAAVADKGTALLHTAVDATTSLRNRIVNDAAPGLRHSVRAVKEHIDAIDLQDDEDDDQGEGERQRGEGSEEEAASDAEEQPAEGLQTRLRSRASQASGAGRQAVERGKALVNEALHSDLGTQAKQALGRAKSDAISSFEHARASGERLVSRARGTVAEFDLGEAQEQAGELADKAESNLREGVSRAQGRLRDELDEAEEDLGMTDEAFNRTVARGLDKFDRVVEKDNNVRLPLLIIGSIFLLWFGASLYQHFGTPIEPPPPANMMDAARMAAHSLKDSGLDQLYRLEARAQELTDRLAGRKRPLTWSEQIGSWASSARDGVFGSRARTDKIDMAHARDSIRNARDAVEERGYGLKSALKDDVAPRVRGVVDGAKQSLEDARKFTAEKLIPGARHGANRAQEAAGDAKDAVNYHASHKDEYVQSAKDSLHRAERYANQKAADLHLIPAQRNMAQRAWDWMTGATTETYPQQAQRVAAELKERLNADIDRLQASLPSLGKPRTVGDRIKSHLPGHHESVEERVHSELAHIRAELHDLQERMTRTVPGVDARGTAQEYYERAQAKGYELRNGAYQLRDDAQRKAHDLTHRSLGERIADGVRGLGAHLPGGRHDSAQDKLQRGVDDAKAQMHELHERAQRNVPGIDVSGTAHDYANRARAAGYELRNGAYQLADRVRARGGDAADMVRNYAAELEAQAQAPTHTTDTHYQPGHAAHTHSHPVQPNHLATDEAVPLRTVLRDISDAQEQPDPLAHPTPRESIVDRVRHAVHDGVEAIKEHLHHNADALQPATEADLLPRAHTYQDLRVPASTQPLRDSVKGRVQRAEDSVRSGIHRADESVRSGLHRADESIRSGANRVADTVLPSDATLRHLRKEAEYAQHRAVHTGEAVGHRVEEKADELAHRAEEKYDQLGHRVEEKVDEVKDKTKRRLP